MLKFILFGLGFVLVFEGLVYFLFSNQTKIIFKIMESFKPEKIRSFSSILIILGLCLIYFSLKMYKI
jgi:uncharacterized protein YjeT (DUF2065 family)